MDVMYLCMYYVCMHVKICLLCIDFFKLRQGASISPNVGLSVGLSVGRSVRGKKLKIKKIKKSKFFDYF